MKDVTKRQRIFLSLSKLNCGHQEIISREIRLHLTFSVNWNKCDKFWKKREFVFKVTSLLPSLSSMLKLPIVWYTTYRLAVMTFGALTLQSPIKSLFSLPYSIPHHVKSLPVYASPVGKSCKLYICSHSVITFDSPNNSLFQLSKCFSEHIHLRFGKRSHVGSKGNDNEAMLS